MNNEYILTVGLEIHAELRTRTKMFCDSKNDPDEVRPNVNVCPICMGHPGTLPVMNKEAVRHILKVGLALGGRLADFTEFDRKNYFYPDIPKGYQLSQYEFPLVSGGSLNGVAITRVHLEEDTGTLIHANENQRISADGHQRESASFVDFNRAGVPLMELVTEPVIKSAREAADFARELQLLLRYLGASDANMEKGEMRVEANISVARRNADAEGAEKRGLLYEDLSYKVRGAAFNVYNALGSGHKESVYQNAFVRELEKIGILYEKEKDIAVMYDTKRVSSYRPDAVVDEKIIVEIKALPFTGKAEREQVRYYLKNSQYRLALIINFGSSPISIERIVYDSIRENPRSNQQKSAPLGTKVEVKNLNSFRAVERAIEYEMSRHIEVIESGKEVEQETRGWDEDTGKTFSQRRKEESHDYRYFPDPDLPKLVIRDVPEFAREKLTADMPELPSERRSRYLALGIKNDDAETLLANRSLGTLLEATQSTMRDRSAVLLAANYIISDLLGLIKKAGLDGDRMALPFSSSAFATLIGMVADKKLSSRGAKDILQVLFEKGGEPEELAARLGLLQQSDESGLKAVAEGVIAANKKVAEDYQSGKTAALQFLVGQGMKATRGSANPEVLRKLFIALLK